MRKIIISLFALVALGTVAGCQSQADSKKRTGSYTAARRNAIGSHIPQPYSADTTNATVDQETFMRDQRQLNSTSSSIGASATGGR